LIIFLGSWSLKLPCSISFLSNFIVLRHVHISNASILLVSRALQVQVSLPYNNRLQANILINDFLILKDTCLLVKRFCFLENACLARAILLIISVVYLFSCVM
jgi:hypothetical protein